MAPTQQGSQLLVKVTEGITFVDGELEKVAA